MRRVGLALEGREISIRLKYAFIEIGQTHPRIKKLRRYLPVIYLLNNAPRFDRCDTERPFGRLQANLQIRMRVQPLQRKLRVPTTQTQLVADRCHLVK